MMNEKVFEDHTLRYQTACQKDYIPQYLTTYQEDYQLAQMVCWFEEYGSIQLDMRSEASETDASDTNTCKTSFE